MEGRRVAASAVLATLGLLGLASLFGAAGTRRVEMVMIPVHQMRQLSVLESQGRGEGVVGGEEFRGKGKAFLGFIESYGKTHPGLTAGQIEGLYTAWEVSREIGGSPLETSPSVDDIRLPTSARPARSVAGGAGMVDANFAAEPEPPMRAAGSVTPETVVEGGEGTPDFNGENAVVAVHPSLGTAPTTLHEHHAETRGSFTIRLARTGSDEDGEVALSIWGPAWPFVCTIRGYRQLSDDFSGNNVFTGFKQSWSGGGDGGRRVDTGYVSPGVRGEYDIVTCRDKETDHVIPGPHNHRDDYRLQGCTFSYILGEVQYFRFGHGGNGNNDMLNDPPVSVLGPHFGPNTDSVTFDMDRPTFEDEKASEPWYDDNYDPAADIKPFS